MTVERLQQVEELFHAALELDPEARQGFLNEACDADRELRAEVEALLQAFAQSPEFIVASSPLIGIQSDAGQRGAAQLGERLGPYRLLREIGRGGMGEVYLAVRDDDQYRKQVAIKLVRRGMDIDSIIRRFRHERQILAGLDHPNIARLLDGGTTEDGLPWLAMEYVEGEPIDAYCDRRQLSINERLKLFRTVCAAAHYAHQNLVVHRDLKPSNILVTKDGEPKLLDFGIAKILDPELYGQTAEQTLSVMKLMTPGYASPEQVKGETITTASDVYSLGVILYELLTGHRPYRIAGRSPHEVLRVVCEEEPVKPSLAVTRVEAKNGSDGSATTPEEVSRARDEQPERLRRRLAGDLDNIVLMALRKEPQRRYPSIEQFSEDVGRHLDGLPVTAGRGTFAYRSGKLVRRNKVLVAALALVMLSLLTGIILAMWQAREARQQAEIALQQRDNARAINNLFRDFLLKGHAKGPHAKFIEVFGELRKQIEEDTKSPREFRNDVHFTLGQILMQRGDYNSAEPHVRAVRELSLELFGETHQRSINSIYHLGIIGWHQGNHEAAVKMIRQAIEMSRLHHSESGALPHMLLDLGARLGNQGKVEEAEKLILEAREGFLKMEGPENQYAAANTLCNLGNLYLEYGQLDQAEKYYLEFLEQVRGLPAKYQANEAPFRLGVIAYHRGDYRKAERLIEESEQMFSQRLEGAHPQVADFLHYLSSIHCRQKNYQRAEAEARRALDIRRRHHKPNEAYTVVALGQLSKVLISAGEVKKAAPYLREAMGAFHAAPVRNTGYWATAAGLLGESLTMLRRYDEAERFLNEGYKHHYSECGETCPGRIEARQRLARLYEAWGKPERAARFR